MPREAAGTALFLRPRFGGRSGAFSQPRSHPGAAGGPVAARLELDATPSLGAGGGVRLPGAGDGLRGVRLVGAHTIFALAPDADARLSAANPLQPPGRPGAARGGQVTGPAILRGAAGLDFRPV